MATRHSGSRAPVVGAGTRKAEITVVYPSNSMRGPVLATVFAQARSRPPILHLQQREMSIKIVALLRCFVPSVLLRSCLKTYYR